MSEEYPLAPPWIEEMMKESPLITAGRQAHLIDPLKPGTIKPGTRVRISGTPFHNSVGTVVDTLTSLLNARELNRDVSAGPARRPGLVPVFLVDCPDTLWWWFAPSQLEPIEEQK